jgi:hypothetical protein
LIGGFGPLGESFGVDADFEVFPKDGDVFAKIEAAAEFGNGGVTLEELWNWRGGEQPCSEGVFAHASAGEREELEEAAGAEEVKVGGVEAGVGVDALACLAGSNPAVLDAG